MKCNKCPGQYKNATSPVGNFYVCDTCGHLPGLNYTENKIWMKIVDIHNMFIETKAEQQDRKEPERIKWVNGIHEIQDVLILRAIDRTAAATSYIIGPEQQNIPTRSESK